MRLFGFGKDEDEPHREEDKGFGDTKVKDDTDEDNASGDVDNGIYNNTEEDIPEEIIDTENEVEGDYDYIDEEDLDHDDYDNIVNQIEYDWTRVSPSPYTITYLDTDIVVKGPTPIKKDTDGTVLTIVCPPERIISICGFNQVDIDKEDFHNSPNIYEVPHFLTLRLADENDIEISPLTIVDIVKITRDGKSVRVFREFYGDLSPNLSPAADRRLRKKSERYYFADTIVLQKGEGLSFVAHRPNIDISKIDIVMMSDLFEKDE